MSFSFHNYTWVGGNLQTWLNARRREVEKDKQNVVSVHIGIVKKDPERQPQVNSTETQGPPANGSSSVSPLQSAFIFDRFLLTNCVSYGLVFLFFLFFVLYTSSAYIILKGPPAENSHNLNWSNLPQVALHHSLGTLRDFFGSLESIVKPKQIIEAPSLKSTVSPLKTIGWDEGSLQLLSFLKEIKGKYPSTQNSYGREQIFAAVSSTMTQEEPGKPTCIVLLIPPTVSSHFTTCYTNQIGRGINSIFGRILGNPKMGKVREIDLNYWEKMEGSVTGIHKDLNEYLQKDGKVLILWDVDKLNKLEQLHILHAYCDNAAGVDNRANLFFPIRVDEELYESLEWKDEIGEKVAKRILTSAWTSMDGEKRGAVVDRVAGTSVLLYPGDKCDKRENLF